MANLANKVKATMHRPEPVPPPPTLVKLEMPEGIAQRLVSILSLISTIGVYGDASYEVYKALIEAGLRPRHDITAKIDNNLGIVVFS